jgi:hypothetical protein
MEQQQTHSSKTTNMINVTGTLQNLLDDGFNIESSIVELIDNSIGAGATQIRIKLVKGDNDIMEFLIIDNGCGMSEDELGEAHVLSNRSEASSVKQGRFGIGGKYARAYITQLEHKATTISKKNNGELYQTVVNFPKHLRDNSYNPATSEVSEKNMSKWLEHSIEPAESGTIIIIPVSEKVINTMYSLFHPTEIEKDITYQYGYIYNDDIRNGLKLTIEFNGIEKQINPIDNLYWDKVDAKYKKIVSVKVYRNKNDVRCYYKNANDEYGYKSFKSSKKGKFIKGIPSKPFIEIGEFTIECAYDKGKWNTIDCIQAAEFQKNKTNTGDSDDESDAKEESGLITNLRPFFGGRYYKRLNKIICRFNNEKAKSGDKSKYHIVDYSRFRITFPETLDEYFAIVVNKSKIDEKNINENIYKTIDLFKKDFINTQHKLSEEEKKAGIQESVTESVTEPDTESVNEPDTESVTESVNEPDTESVNESLNEPTTEPATEPATETVNQSINETVIKSVTETFNETVIESVNEPDTESVTESIMETDVEESYTSPADVTPIVVNRENTTAQTITVDEGIGLLEYWFRSNQHIEELNEVLEKLLIDYTDRVGRAQVTIFIQNMERTSKYNTAMGLIDLRYGDNNTVEMLDGSYIYTNYNVHFE